MKIAIVMPAYNEAEGIYEFISEICESFEFHSLEIFVVNDLSTDATVEEIERLKNQAKITILTNSENSGHGRSTLTALRAGLGSGAEFVLSVDGDGQFLGGDLLNVALRLETGQFDIVEGARTNRSDPLFRKLTSFVTRGLVFLRCGVWPIDANTPLRCYEKGALGKLLDTIPAESQIPNLWISFQSRKGRYKISEMRVSSLERRGATSTGTMWGKGLKFIPSKRFIDFCRQATVEWLFYKQSGVSK